MKQLLLRPNFFAGVGPTNLAGLPTPMSFALEHHPGRAPLHSTGWLLGGEAVRRRLSLRLLGGVSLHHISNSLLAWVLPQLALGLFVAAKGGQGTPSDFELPCL